jgi:hypothetical protein
MAQATRGFWKDLGMSDPRATADRYVEVATADGKEALAELFAPTAVFMAPDGNTYQGRTDIAGFYARHLANVVPEFHIQNSVSEGRSCWIELANGTLDDPLYLATNHFTVDGDGLIERLAVFLRPRPT